jgi:hypothetical protein
MKALFDYNCFVTRSSKPGARRQFHLVMIKPSHYDDNGYVIQWIRSAIPSNTLAALNGLAEDCARREVLGDDVDLMLTTIDETNTRVGPDRIIKLIQDSGGLGMVALVGVQTNQFPHAMDLARPMRAAGLQVAIGGFHVSGCISMLPKLPADIQEAKDLGISLFAGEAEGGRLDEVLQDAAAGALKPLYNYMNDLPGLEGAELPLLPPEHVRHTAGSHTSFDAGRGCPFQCSFCTIINVQGRKSRYRSADDIEGIIRENFTRGINRFFITDDNFARNKDWEAVFDRIIELRENEGIDVRFLIQVDTLCHRIPNFIEKAGRAGEHQPGKPRRHQEASEQDYRVPNHVADVEGHRRYDLCRLHPGLPDRYAGDHRPRYRDHQERTAARPAGILLSDPPCPARKITKTWTPKGSGWIPT